MTLGYIRVSTDKQDLEKQRHLLLEWANQNKIIIDDWIEVEASSTKKKKDRKIEELIDRLGEGDTLVVAELSRLGRNMLEVLNIIEELTKKGVNLVFIRQPELSTTGPHGKLLLAIYSYFAEAERDFISRRTKEGLAAAKAKGKLLGRPKGQGSSKLDPFKNEILDLLNKGVSISSIAKIVNSKMENPASYPNYIRYIERDDELRRAKENFKKGSLLNGAGS